MAFNERDYNLERWLELEVNNMLQKVCNLYDDNGRIVEQFRTKVKIVPKGQSFQGKISISSPALHRAYTYSDQGRQIASLPSIKEWLPEHEAAASGDISQLEEVGGTLSVDGANARAHRQLENHNYAGRDYNNLGLIENNRGIALTLNDGSLIYKD